MFCRPWCAGTKNASTQNGTVRSTRDGDTGNEDDSSFAGFAMLSFAMTSGLASDSDKFKLAIALRRAQQFGDTGPYTIFVFSYNPLVPEFSFALIGFVAGIFCESYARMG